MDARVAFEGLAAVLGPAKPPSEPLPVLPEQARTPQTAPMSSGTEEMARPVDTREAMAASVRTPAVHPISTEIPRTEDPRPDAS